MIATLRAQVLGGLLAALAVVGLLAGCTSSAVPSDEPPAPAGIAITPDHLVTDLTFAQDVRTQHTQGRELAGLADGRANDPAVLELATRIDARQGTDLARLEEMLEVWSTFPVGPAPAGAEPVTPTTTPAPIGTLTPERLEALEPLSGPEFDVAWLEAMIESHTGAVAAAQSIVELPPGGNAQARELANEIFQTQQSEIIEMNRLLEG